MGGAKRAQEARVLGASGLLFELARRRQYARIRAGFAATRGRFDRTEPEPAGEAAFHGATIADRGDQVDQLRPRRGTGPPHRERQDRGGRQGHRPPAADA